MIWSDVHPLDKFGAELAIRRQKTATGPRAFEIFISCPLDHPTGITTTMIQSITAQLLKGDTGPQVSLEDFVAGLPQTKWSPGRKNPMTDALLAEVASTYMKALEAQQPALKTVAAWLGSSTPTASNLIKEARRRRLIKEVPRPGRPSKK